MGLVVIDPLLAKAQLRVARHHLDTVEYKFNGHFKGARQLAWGRRTYVLTT
jgi:hypothetical protein